MKQMSLILFFSLFCTIFFGLISRSASVPSTHLLGIPPEDESYYNALSTSGTMKCKDGSKKFTKSQLNDDFCDCPDGTDEPGTSACPDGKFYCRNAGHAPLFMFSSRVNDGICDCCDGSDEYDGIVKCSNTCWEAGKVARDRLKKKIATFQEGVTLRKQEIEQAKLAIAKDEAELSKLKNEEKVLKGLVEQLKEHKEKIEKAEEKERLQKEKEEKEKKEAEEAQMEKSKDVEDVSNQGKPLESTNDDHIGLLDDSLSDKDVVEHSLDPVHEFEYAERSKDDPPPNGVQEDSAMKEEDSSVAHDSGSDSNIEEKDASENTEALSKEELGRLVASRWTRDTTGQQTGEVDDGKDDKHEISEEAPDDAHDEEYEGYESESEDDSQKYNEDDEDDDHVEDFEEEKHDDFSSPYKSASDDELDLSGLQLDDFTNPYKSASDDELDVSDITTSSSPSWLEKIQQTVRNILQAVNLFQTPVDVSEAAQVRKEYDESSSKLSKIQSRISSLTKKLNQDFGPEKEFYSFYSKCFEIKQNKYVYKICPFKQASQEEGHSTTRLGNWDKFEDSYKALLFSSGDKCWNGPDRSLKVRLRCGLKNEATDVDEPSRCEYVALLSTPVLCVEEKLKELQDKLDLMNKQQPQSHDEL